MNDTAIKNYAIWARRELLAEVRKGCQRWGIAPTGVPEADAAVVDGQVLTAQQRTQRAELLREAASAADGFERLVERAAYTWFNRLVAIRYMELNDRLPSHVRVLSARDGNFEPEALHEALDLPLDALDHDETLRLVQAGDDEALFRAIFLAQCAELADCMPAVFEPVGSSLELLLPDGLLRAESVAGRLVRDIPEEDWLEPTPQEKEDGKDSGITIVGWMYQHYISERKDEVFASFKKGKKAERDAIAPATQLFTPHWIVQYLTENSLGRLWMLNHPESPLAEKMRYYIKPDEDTETAFLRIASPEDITVVDPACGSGHILVYAFELLARMYEEAGYSNRDTARLILEENLTGLEIDARAAELASFALTMKACELDSRFLRRGVTPKITVFERVEFEDEELALCQRLSANKDLIDAALHLDECGSLLQPTDADLDDIAWDLAALDPSASLFAGSAVTKLKKLLTMLKPLAAAYDVVVTNPPYMGSKNMNSWLGTWVKKHYPDVKGDLFSCFITRNVALGENYAQLGYMSPYVWMFIGTYEKLRHFIIEQNTITSLVQLEYSGFAGATVPICTFTLQKGCCPGYRGGYIRLSDFVGTDKQAPKTLEAIANPTCGWFYRRTADTFNAIPGSRIAYWASEGLRNDFMKGVPLSSVGQPRQGLATGENARFVRTWWEVSQSRSKYDCSSIEESVQSGCRWFPYNKGGEYRKWYGNNDYIIDWCNDGEDIKLFRGSVIRNPQYYFKESITWSKISSGSIAFRYKPKGHVFDVAGTSIFANEEELKYLHGACNSSSMLVIASILSPTLNYEVGQIATYPIVESEGSHDEVLGLVNELRHLSIVDWDSSEISWAFERHPMV